jgi:hypothetical protein
MEHLLGRPDRDAAISPDDGRAGEPNGSRERTERLRDRGLTSAVVGKKLVLTPG